MLGSQSLWSFAFAPVFAMEISPIYGFWLVFDLATLQPKEAKTTNLSIFLSYF